MANYKINSDLFRISTAVNNFNQSNTYVLEISLTERGKPFLPSSGSTFLLTCLRSDNVLVRQDIKITNASGTNVILITLDSQCVAYKGDTKFNLIVTNTTLGSIATFAFNGVVQASVVSDTSVNPAFRDTMISALLNASKAPYIHSNGYWYELNPTTGLMESTEVKATGLSVSSISRTSGTGVAGATDTYTVTYSDETTSTFNITNGTNGQTITSIEKTSTVDLVDTYTITYNTGDPDTFTVTNGAKGDKGDAATIEVGTVTSGVTPSVTNVGTSGAATLNFVLEKGDTGTTFTPSVSENGDISWSNDKEITNPATVNIKGDKGDAATITVGTVASGVSPTVTNVGTSNAAVLNFVLQKGDKGDMGDGSPHGVFATLAALQADATSNTADGKKYTYVVEADGKLYYWNGTAWTAGVVYQAVAIADGSVTVNKLNTKLSEILYTEVTSKNIYDKSLAVDNKVYHDTTGEMQNSTTYALSGMIPVASSTSYTMSAVGVTLLKIHLWNGSTYLTGKNAANPSTFTTPSNCTHVSVSMNLGADHSDAAFQSAIDVLQLEAGGSVTEYAAFAYKNMIKEENCENTADISLLPAINTLLYTNLTRPAPCKNIYDPSLAVNGYYYNDATGAATALTNSAITGLIPVEPSTQYAISIDQAGSAAFLAVIQYYSSGETSLGYNLSPTTWTGARSAVFTTPSNCAYIGATFLFQTAHSTAEFDTLKATIQLEKGSAVTSFLTFNQPLVIKAEAYEKYADVAMIPTLDTDIYGKKWVCVGDSITEVNVRTTSNYHKYIAAELGLTVVNMGVSGTGYLIGGSSYPFYTRILDIPTDADIVTIMGSINDIGQSLGTPTDTGTTTICGCVNTALDNLFSVITAPHLGIISPTPCETANGQSAASTMSLYCDALQAICKIRNVPYLDLLHGSNLRPWVAVDNALLFSCAASPSGDGVHPNAAGHAMIKNAIKRFIMTL